MSDNQSIFDELLAEFHKKGILPHFTLIGSWCLAVYKVYFNNSPEIPVLRTMDIDVLIPQNLNLEYEIDIPQMLKKYGFDEEFSHLGGYSKFVHPELEIEFLVAEYGKGKERPYNIKSLNITAQGLRYVSLIHAFNITVQYNNIPVRVPEPSAFVLLKYLISTKRRELSKKKKDIITANDLGDYLLNNSNEKEKLRKIFQSMHKKWQLKTISVVKKHSPLLFNYLKKE